MVQPRSLSLNSLLLKFAGYAESRPDIARGRLYGDVALRGVKVLPHDHAQEDLPRSLHEMNFGNYLEGEGEGTSTPTSLLTHVHC